MDIREIDVALLDVGEHEQRFDYDGDEMDDLVASLRKDGVLVPLIVRNNADRYIVIEGHRRREAAIRASLHTVPCQILSPDPSLCRRVAFVANLFRKDPTPIELGVAIARAVSDGEASVEEMAKGLNRSTDWVRRQVAMMSWPEDVLQAIHAGRISVAAAANLAAVTDDAYRSSLVGYACENGATARTTAAWLQQWEAGQPSAQALLAPPIDGEHHPPPLMPQAPCLSCGVLRRTDELSHVPLCAPCIQRVMHLSKA